ncbi:hypothetical protein O3M35_010715 [Rhynocoris fuscipes]|uniref:Protein CDV3 homolog n=1 Tax=Rhynocoris fuscipes TaxID=488301 RepID=A0AAW1D1B5_9HEMI
MADLDDFFAKKDRKKSKGKKFATADEIAKKLEETGRRSEKMKKDKQLQDVDEQGNAVQDEDEWREFEEEKKDYSGLKIQNLTLADYDSADEGCSGDDEVGLEENEAGEMVPRKKQTGPWRTVPSVEEKPEEEQPVQPPPQPTSQSYVPPALRNQTKNTPFNSRLRRKVAPDVRSEELFPTLSAANTQEPASSSSSSSSSWGKKKGKEDGGTASSGFEEVRNSKSHTARYEPPHLQNKQLALGNKYGALDSEQS